MTNQFPDATKMVPLPPPELVQQWVRRLEFLPDRQVFSEVAQWGADQELEACCKWFANEGYGTAPDRIRMHRRPKPPSLKEQALLQLDTLSADLAMHGRGCDLSQIRRALEALPND
jgi:hypothetical protein